MENKPRKSNENNFMTILNLIVDPAVIVDEKGHLLLVNNALEEMTGFSKKEIIGKAFFELNLLPPKSKKILLENLKKRMQGLPVEPYEVTFTDKTGKVRYVEIKAKKIDYVEHSADLVIFRDVTRRKESARRLKEYSEKMEALVNKKVKEVKESEERYRELTESISDVFFAMDKNLRYTYWNKASEKLTGISAKDAIGKSLTEIFPDIKETKVEQFYKKVLRTKQSQSFVNKYRVKDKNFVFEISAYPTMAGLSVFVKDITERKRAEENLKKEQQELDCMIDSSPIIIFYKDKEGKFIRVNKAFAEALKIPQEEFVGKTVFDFYSDEIAQSMTNDDLEVLKSGCPKLGIIEQYESASGIRWVQTDKVPIFDENGVPNGVLGFAQDITERKKAEETLKESEEKFRNLGEQSPNMIFINQKGRIVYANKKCEEVMGYKREEFYSPDFDFFTLIAPEYIDLMKSSFSRHIKDEEVAPLEYALITKEGKRIEAILTTKLIAFKGETAILGIVTDITERKRMEEALQESEEKYRSMIEQAPDLIVTIDEKGIVTSCNSAFERGTDYSQHEIIGKYFLETPLLHGIDPAYAQRLFNAIIEEKNPEPIELTWFLKDGTPRISEVRIGLMKKDGKIAGFTAVARDITESKKAEEALRKSEEKYRELINGMNDTAWVIGFDGNFIDVNDAAVKVLGYSREELLSMGPPDIDNSLTKEQIKDLIRSMPADQIQVFETAHTTKDGKPIPVEISSSLVTYQGKQAILSIARDITERKIMQDRLAESSQKLEKLVEKRTEQLKQTQAKLVKSERLATIGELAAMIGHDLRNPLTGIMGAAYYLKAKHSTEMGAKGKEMLETIEKAINHSNKIINDLLEYSQDLKLDFTATTPKAMLQSALSSLEVPENIQVIDATKDKPMLRVDTEKIRKVFVNIIQNAIDAMPEGGTLTIRSRKVKSKLEIAFQDTGAGMSEETLSKLEGGVPLFTTKAKGMGFGLPICRRLTEVHGGKICVESTLGKGTTVTVTISVNAEPGDEGEEKWIFSESMLSAITSKQRAP